MDSQLTALITFLYIFLIYTGYYEYLAISIGKGLGFLVLFAQQPRE